MIIYAEEFPFYKKGCFIVGQMHEFGSMELFFLKKRKGVIVFKEDINVELKTNSLNIVLKKIDSYNKDRIFAFRSLIERICELSKGNMRDIKEVESIATFQGSILHFIYNCLMESEPEFVIKEVEDAMNEVEEKNYDEKTIPDDLREVFKEYFNLSLNRYRISDIKKSEVKQYKMIIKTTLFLLKKKINGWNHYPNVVRAVCYQYYDEIDIYNDWIKEMIFKNSPADIKRIKAIQQYYIKKDD